MLSGTDWLEDLISESWGQSFIMGLKSDVIIKHDYFSLQKHKSLKARNFWDKEAFKTDYEKIQLTG